MSFQAVREKVARFCSDREWEKFHLPASIVLALSVECGEVSEIFQWKGTLETDPFAEPPLTPKEIVHIGEEMADVLIYTTRLSDICGIDLAHAIQCKLTGGSFTRQDRTKVWSDVLLDDLKNSSFVSAAHHRSQRHVCFLLLAEAGSACALFAAHPEIESGVGLPGWGQGDVEALAGHLATVCLLLGSLCKFGDHSLQQCVADKFIKNAKKYPADQARGSSAKYTAYANSADHKGKVLSWLPVRWSTLGRYALITAGTLIVADFIFAVGFNTGLRINFRTETHVAV